MLSAFRSRNELEINPGTSYSVIFSPSGDHNSTRPKKLRLCYISNPNIIHTHRWLGWFARQGHTVCLLADVPLKEPWSEVPVIDLSEFFHVPIIRFPVWAVWLRRFIHQWRPDVLHAHRVNSAGWLAASSGFHPYVVTPWGSDVFIGTRRSWAARLLARYSLEHADRVTTISQAIRHRVIELGARSNCIDNINHGVDLDIFNPALQSSLVPDTLRQSLSLPDNARLVFSPRAIRPIYNQDIVLQAIPLVRERFPGSCFIFSAYNTDPGYKSELDRFITEMGLGETIRWLPSTRNPAEMAQWYRLSDVVVSVPSSDGGTPLTVMEAMACGKPVVCSDLPAVREFITSGENGWLVPVRQAAPLADAIIRVLAHPEQAVEFGRKAAQLVADRANLEVEMKRMEAIYYQLAERRKD